MKQYRYILLAALLLAGAGVVWQWGPFHSDADAAPTPVAWKGPPPSSTISDPAVVFQRAFWRAPGPEDEILHAERHEWKDAEGLTKWQWFLEVNPSPGLVKYLREDNAFGLAPAAEAPLPEERPAWYRYDPSAVSVLKSPRGRLQLIFSKTGNTLYATDSGAGFQKAASEPGPVATSSTPPAPRRLPTAPPPNPNP